LPGKYKVFVAGLDINLKITQIVNILKPFGSFRKFALKIRSKKPEMNLGYGVLSTDQKDTYDKLINTSSLDIESSIVQFRPYQVHECFHVLCDQSKSTLFLSGFDKLSSI
jgi:hypothetical protein